MKASRSRRESVASLPDGAFVVVEAPERIAGDVERSSAMF
jgi:hypothetical protein